MTKILIVVDDAARIQEVADILGKAGFSTKTLHSGSEVFRALPQTKPEIVLVGKNTPGIEHIVVLAFIRHLAEVTGMKVFVITQDVEIADAERSSWKAEVVLTGPLSPEAFLKAVSIHL